MVISAFDAMNDALEQCSDLGFEMSPGFATHWPMGSETLIALGHPEAVHDWAGIYRTKREHYPRPAVLTAINAGDESSWRSALGQYESRGGDWQVLFEKQLAEQPWQEVLVRWWPTLMPGVAAGLTHGLIRTMHIVRSIDRSPTEPTPLQLRELATALSYWAAHYVEQPGAAQLRGPLRLPDVFGSIPRLDPANKIGLRDKGLFRHMPDVVGWDTAVNQLACPNDIQSAISDLTLSFVRINLGNPNQIPIPLIHCVTAPAALRVMLGHLPDEMHLPSFIAMWQATAALLTTFAPYQADELSSSDSERDMPTLSRQELSDRAVEHGDEHAMKFTEACLREYDVHADPLYLRAPEKMLGKLPRYYRRAHTSQGHRPTSLR